MVVCRVEAFHYTYTVSLPALIIGFIQCGSTPTFLRRNIIHGGSSIDALLAHNFRILLREEHERRMSDEDGSRRGVDIGNLLAGLVPGTMTSNTGSGSAGGGESSNRLGVGGREGAMTEFPLSATNGSWMAQAKKEAEDAYSLSNGIASGRRSPTSQPNNIQQQSGVVNGKDTGKKAKGNADVASVTANLTTMNLGDAVPPPSFRKDDRPNGATPHGNGYTTFLAKHESS
jgi:hypothetical protein